MRGFRFSAPKRPFFIGFIDIAPRTAHMTCESRSAAQAAKLSRADAVFHLDSIRALDELARTIVRTTTYFRSFVLISKKGAI